MTSAEPPKPSKILATPIENVEESRAQRLQRQQSRFRDRGGIFVPSSRNTLLDILLGKASPLKKPRRSRSASASPTKGRGKSAAEPPQELVPNLSRAISRRSPRKHGAKHNAIDSESLQVAGPSSATKFPMTDGVKSTSKPATKKSSNVQNLKELGQESALEDDTAPVQHDSSTKKSPKKAPKATQVKKASTSTARPRASKVKKMEVRDEDDDADLPKPPKGKKGATKAKPNVKASTSKDVKAALKSQKPSGSTSQSVIATPDISSSTAPIKPVRSRKASDIYSCGESEDEYLPKMTQKGKEKATATKNLSSKSNSKAPPKQPKPKPSANQLPDIMEEDEEDLPEKESIPSPNVSAVKATVGSQLNASKAVVPPITKKRALQELDDSAETPQRQGKRSKLNSTSKPREKKAVKKASEVDDAPPAKVSKKRPRSANADNDDDPEEDHSLGKKAKPAKRKKVGQDGQSDPEVGRPSKKNASRTTSKANSKLDSTKATKPSSRRPQTKTAYDPSCFMDDAQGTDPELSSKRKENSIGSEEPHPQETESKTASQRGPPKSVLLRIKNAVLADPADNEPDPIDFLS